VSEPLRVVLVDDDATLLGAVAEALAATGRYVVVGTASEAETGLRLILDADPDVAVVDARMPVGGGHVLVQRLRARGRSTPVLMFSAHADPLAADRAKAAGATGFLAKGTTLAELDRTLRSIAGVGSAPCVASD
jgi:two-component system response regulator DesR